MQPRPSSRISSLEKRATTIEAAIEELSSDQAEELKAIRQTLDTNFTEVKQELKHLVQDKTGWEEVDAYLKLMATKDDIGRLEARLDTMATKDDISHLEGLIKQLLQQKPSE